MKFKQLVIASLMVLRVFLVTMTASVCAPVTLMARTVTYAKKDTITSLLARSATVIQPVLLQNSLAVAQCLLDSCASARSVSSVVFVTNVSHFTGI